ncbi:MAG: class II aldolase/adducin family protein [Candidatus Margulisbacteria bacterium]|nr:class II aldolase/adducin family protein [Candidatus Margulisiibacteriota bacterium]
MTISKKIVEKFQNIGQDAFLTGLIASKSGNMSVRLKDKMIITTTGSSLGRLTENQLVTLSINNLDSPNLKKASTAVYLHQAIYKKTDAQAIIHLHCPAAVALSISEREITPIDSEGIYYFQRIPVIHKPFQAGSKNVLNELADLLKDYRVAIVSPHGVFAKGKDLDEAFFWASSVEQSSKIIIQRRLLDQGKKI